MGFKDDKTYKSFSAQMRECRENENLFKEECTKNGHKLIMCKKHGGQCRSYKCLEERKSGNTNVFYPRDNNRQKW